MGPGGSVPRRLHVAVIGSLEVAPMGSHLIRLVVKHGHSKDFKAAAKKSNEVAVPLGLPAYRYYQSNWGTFNEVFGEAEYENSGDIEQRFAATEDNAELDEATRVLFGYLVEGEAHDYVLSDMPLG
jgi:hypothetical protein